MVPLFPSYVKPKTLKETNGHKQSRLPSNCYLKYPLPYGIKGPAPIEMATGTPTDSIKGASLHRLLILPVPDTNGRLFPQRLCFNCNCMGHIANFCHEPDRRGNSGAGRLSYNFTQYPPSFLSKWWLLLDTCFTCSVTNNPDLLTSLNPCPPLDILQVVTNGGGMIFDKKGKLKLLPIKVHYNPASLVTILSFKTLTSMPNVRIQYNNDIDDSFKITLPKKFVLYFKSCASGLYYLDSTSININLSLTNTNDISFLSTVSANKQFWTKKEIQGANNARKLQELLSWPSTSTLKSHISNNLISDTNITLDNINQACKGTITRLHPNTHKITRIPLPLPIAQNHKNIQLYIDFMFVNSMPFLLTVSKSIKYHSIHPCTTTNYTNIKKALNSIAHKYTQQGFQIDVILANNEFDIKALHKHLLPPLLHIYTRNKHVGPAEREIRTTKESTRAVCHAAPYKRYTKLMVCKLLDNVIQNLNSFPVKNSVSDCMSSSSILDGTPWPSMGYKQISFGSYALVWIQITNDMKRRGIPAISLGKSNQQGGHYFMLLHLGKQIHSYNWQELPVPNDVIDHVEELAEEENQPILTNKLPMFKWMPGVPIPYDDIIEETPLHPHDSPAEAQAVVPQEPIPKINKYQHDDSSSDDSTDISHILHDHPPLISDSNFDMSIVVDENEPIYLLEHALISDNDNSDLSYDSQTTEDIPQDPIKSNTSDDPISITQHVPSNSQVDSAFESDYDASSEFSSIEPPEDPDNLLSQSQPSSSSHTDRNLDEEAILNQNNNETDALTIRQSTCNRSAVNRL